MNCRCLWLLPLLCAGCVTVDESARAVVRYMEFRDQAVRKEVITLDKCRGIYPDVRRKLIMEKLFYRAAAAQLKVDICEKFCGTDGGRLEHYAGLLAARAAANADLAAAAGLAPETGLEIDLSGWKEEKIPPFTEKELRAVMLLKNADRGIYPTARRSLPLELELHKRFIALLKASELSLIARDKLKKSAAAEPSRCSVKSGVINSELALKTARIALLEMIGESDFSNVPAYLKRLEAESVRLEKVENR